MTSPTEAPRDSAVQQTTILRARARKAIVELLLFLCYLSCFVLISIDTTGAPLMDSIVCSALEEICASGGAGITINALWPKLQPAISSTGLDLCHGVRASLWSRLIRIPDIQFKHENISYSTEDPAIHDVVESERMNLTLIPEEHIRDNFCGIYDLRPPNGGIPSFQRFALGIIADARSNGITQSELAKKCHKNGNAIFAIVRNLESQGLVRRHSTVVRTKKFCGEGDMNSSSAVSTNTIYLHRYGRSLGSQQRLEVTREDKNAAGSESVLHIAPCQDGDDEEVIKEEVLVSDFLPELKAVCDKLKAANGKVLVITDIKKDLGYRGKQGNRRWRHVCKKLKDAGLVEEFRAAVNQKDTTCLRLVREFSPNAFEEKIRGAEDDCFDDHMAQPSKYGQITDQILELPLDHVIYDMIDAEGTNGLTFGEVCQRLGINRKKNYRRLLDIRARFGLEMKAENRNRGFAYRFWTPGNFNRASDTTLKNINDDSGHSTLLEGSSFGERNCQAIVPLISNEDSEASEPRANEAMIEFRESGEDSKSINEDLSPNNLVVVDPSSVTVSNAGDNLANIAVQSSFMPPKGSLSALSKSIKPRSSIYPCTTFLTATTAQREQRILQLLQEEKFILRAELHRWLEHFEKEKSTIMDRRTLIRILNKFQKQGLCRCIDISVPVITNCHRRRIVQVVLHPSFENLTTELIGQIHDRVRSFDMQVRREGLSRSNKEISTTVLNDVQRISSSVGSDAKTIKLEIMRNNGFVLAKMVRAKLLHCFLWDYLNSLIHWDDSFFAGNHGCDMNPHSVCKLFALDTAIKAMPLELFLQVAGSSTKFDNMIERCKIGMRLCDLSNDEYRNLMDTHATGRLSWIVDILRRLKLIRLVTEGLQENDWSVSHAILTHAMELRPYIEEPLSIILPSANSALLDLRPRRRHDFVLSTRHAVELYWKTLEYCYASSAPAVALHAFPGTVVHEVFLRKSWTTIRVMTTDQRAELLKHVARQDSSKNLSFKECERIATDLNVTLEQVVRFFRSKRQQRHLKSLGDFNNRTEEIRCSLFSQKRRKFSDRQTLGWTKSDNDNEGNNQPNDKAENLGSSTRNDDCFPLRTADQVVNAGSERSQDEFIEHRSFISHCTFSRFKATRQKKFQWSEEAERQLIVQYSEYRATLGAKFHRIQWNALPGLPAPPAACRRKIQILMSNTNFRKSLLRLCGILSQRYMAVLEKLQGGFQKNSGTVGFPRVSLARNFADSIEEARCSEMLSEKWNDFSDNGVKAAFEEVLRYKQLAKLEGSKQNGSEKWPELNIYDGNYEHTGACCPISGESVPNPNNEYNHSQRRVKTKGGLRDTFVRLMTEETTVYDQVHESLAVSNAIELFKLIFLSPSTSPEVSCMLAETLRRYSEHDLFAAFNYLRMKKIMVAGTGTQPFVLSQHFLQNIASSPFPANTGKRAAKFISWLHQNKEDMMVQGINIEADLQCGDIFHLFALVSSGELSITPCLPDEGVGEAEDSKNTKRKAENDELCYDERAKKSNFFAYDYDITCRREKGFPGIVINLSREFVSAGDALEAFGCDEAFKLSSAENDQLNSEHVEDYGNGVTHIDFAEEVTDCSSNLNGSRSSSMTLWEDMANRAKQLYHGIDFCNFRAEIFRTVCMAVQKAGDQGLSMKVLSAILDLDEKNVEIIVEVLGMFRQAFKVYSYDSVYIVDALYRNKYFISSTRDLCTPEITHIPHSLSTSPGMSSEMDSNGTHRVTILNHPEESHSEIGIHPNQADSNKEATDEILEASLVDSDKFAPIFPWMCGDGTVNKIVYNGLVRRIVGIVMQNPGILEDDIIRQMDVLNPQSCRKLVELLVMDKHLIVRKLYQTSALPPSLLSGILGDKYRKPTSIYRDHFFANPLSTHVL